MGNLEIDPSASLQSIAQGRASAGINAVLGGESTGLSPPPLACRVKRDRGHSARDRRNSREEIYREAAAAQRTLGDARTASLAPIARWRAPLSLLRRGAWLWALLILPSYTILMPAAWDGTPAAVLRTGYLHAMVLLAACWSAYSVVSQCRLGRASSRRGQPSHRIGGTRKGRVLK